MGAVKGEKDYLNFKKGIKLNKQQAIHAMCFTCNGGKESTEDCQMPLCPLYPHSKYARKVK